MRKKGILHPRLLFLLLSLQLHCCAVTAVEMTQTLSIESASADYCNDQIHFNGNVIVKHPLGDLRADKAVVDQPGKGGKIAGQNAPSLVILSANPDSNGCCQLETPDGKHIEASSMHIDTAARQLLLKSPRGYMTISRGDDTVEQNLDFSAGTLTWEEPFHVMTLRDHVIFQQGEMGTLVADEQIEVRESCEGTKRILSSITSKGKTILTYREGEKTVHSLTSYGEICVDHEQMQVLLTGSDNMQIHFKDNFGEFFSDKASVTYDIVNHHIQATTLVLDGHVHVRNQFARMETPQNPLVQYAMADHIEYALSTREILLSANKGQRVLFYDKLNNVQVSAPAMRMKRDPKTQQESIKGEGDVRFTFATHELDRLQTYFEKGNHGHGNEAR